MKIHNVGSVDIAFSDLRIPACGAGRQILLAGADAIVYDEDAERSNGLKALLLSGEVTNIGADEPNDGTVVADAIATTFGAAKGALSIVPDAVVAAGDPPTKAEFDAVVALVNELKGIINVMNA